MKPRLISLIDVIRSEVGDEIVDKSRLDGLVTQTPLGMNDHALYTAFRMRTYNISLGDSLLFLWRTI